MQIVLDIRLETSKYVNYIGDKTGNIKVWRVHETQNLDRKHHRSNEDSIRHKALTGNIKGFWENGREPPSADFFQK